MVARVSGGATSPWDWRVYVVPMAHVGSLEGKYQVFGASHVDSLRVAWHDSQTLIAQYGYADIYAFRNLWRSGDSPRVIEMRLAPTAPSSIPPIFP